MDQIAFLDVVAAAQPGSAHAAAVDGQCGLDEARKAMILTKTLWRAELETSALDEVKRK